MNARAHLFEALEAVLKLEKASRSDPVEQLAEAHKALSGIATLCESALAQHLDNDDVAGRCRGIAAAALEKIRR